MTDPKNLLVNSDKIAQRVYLNTAAEGLLLQKSADAVCRYLEDKSRGEPGRRELFAAHDNTRRLAAELFGVTAEQIALLSSTTEALNTIASGIDWREGDEVLFTSVEFPSNMFPWVSVAEKFGIATRVIEPRDGLVRIDDLLEAITDRTRLVTISQVSYATGQHLNPDPIWDRIKDSPTLLCVDATQAAGRVPVSGARADFVVASTFKWLNSIHGSAILSVSRRAIEQNVLGPSGWFSTDDCYRDDRLERFHPRDNAGRFHAGMPNFDSVYSLEAALEFHSADRVKQRPAELAPLVNQLHSGLVQRGLEVLTPAESEHQAGIVAFSNSDSENVKRAMAERGIAIHGDDGRVRAAVHWYNTVDDIERYLLALDEIVCKR